MSIIYTLCPVQIPKRSHERLHFSFLQWDALVDIVDMYFQNRVEANNDFADKPSLRALYHFGYDEWFLLPGDYVFDRDVMQGYFEIVDLLLDDPHELTQLAATVDSWAFDKFAIADNGTKYPINAYTADLFRADVEKLRRFFNKHSMFFFA